MEKFFKSVFNYGLFLVIILTVRLPAQNNIDSLKQLLTVQKGSERLNTLLALSQRNLYVDSKQSKIYAEEALSLARQLGDENSRAMAYYFLGFSKYRLGNYTEALNDLNESMDSFNNLKNYYSLAMARNMAAIINYYIGRYEIATKLYSQNLVYYKSGSMMKDYSKMLINLANVYYQKGNYDKALENLLEAEPIAKQYASNDDYLIGNLFGNIGEAYFGKKEYTLALNNYQTAIEYLNKIKLIDGIANIQMDIGAAHLEMKNFPGAINYFNLALKNYIEIKYTKGVMDVKEKIVGYYKAVNQPAKALEELHNLELLCIDAKDTVMLSKCYNHYAGIYEAKNDYAAASKYFRKYFTLKNIIEKEEHKQNIIALQVVTDAEQKEMDNMVLKQVNELQKERLKRNMLIYFSVIAGLILFSVFLYVLYKKEKNIRKYTVLLEKKNEEINVQNIKLEEIIQAKDKFFSILAHNLKNPFWAILGLNKLLGENYYEYSDSEKMEIITRMGSSTENVYKLFENLLSWAKTQQSTIKPIKEKLNAAGLFYNSIKPYEIRAKDKNVNINVKADKDIFFSADKFMLETIIGNFVDNAIKFSHENSNVTVAAFRDNKELTILIEDNGIGIAEDKIGKLFKIGENISSKGTLREEGTGLGLIICNEFVKLNNGQVTVESILNEGTKFTVRLPIE
jgi:signal transduction histidine kinase